MKPNTRPRLTDVALLAGVSTATASRALSNPDLVAPSTRKAVEDAARTCGYKVNLVARSLRTQRSQTILVLVPGIGNQFYPEIIEGLESCARGSGYSIILGFTGKDAEREQSYIELLNNQRADGLVIVDDGVRHMVESGVRFAVPTVQLMEAECGSSIASVRIDDMEAACMATRHLIELGHRRIAHVCGRKSSIVAGRRLSGYRKALDGAGLAADAELVLDGTYDFDSGVAAVDRVKAMAQPPSAVFCANDATALGALWRCRKLGIGVPQQLSIVGIDDIADAALSDPPLTTIRQPRHQLGTTGMAVLIELIDGRHSHDVDIVLPHELVVRASTAAPAYS